MMTQAEERAKIEAIWAEADAQAEPIQAEERTQIEAIECDICHESTAATWVARPNGGRWQACLGCAGTIRRRRNTGKGRAARKKARISS